MAEAKRERANHPTAQSTSLRELIAGMARGEVPPPPVAEFVGLQLVSAEPDAAVMELAVERHHHNPMGMLQGGILATLADGAMGYAYAAGLGDGESFTTIGLHVDYVKGVREGTVRASARVVRRGRTIGLVECDVTDERGDLVARASSTCMTLRPGG